MGEHKHYVRVCTNIYIVLHSFKSFFYNLEEWNKMFHSVQMYQANINHLIYQSYDLAFYKIYTNKYLNHKQNIRVWIFSSKWQLLFIFVQTNTNKRVHMLYGTLAWWNWLLPIICINACSSTNKYPFSKIKLCLVIEINFSVIN